MTQAWIMIRSRRRADALIVRGSWREVARQSNGAALYRIPADVDASLLDGRGLIALADRLQARNQAAPREEAPSIDNRGSGLA